YPGTFMLEPDGTVTSRHFEVSYVERNTVAQVQVTLNGSEGSVTGTRLTTDHLDVTTYSSDDAVAPGNRFALVFEIRPRPGMHVYAPGAESYRVISFNIEPHDFVRTLPVAYPESEVYHFEPLDFRTTRRRPLSSSGSECSATCAPPPSRRSLRMRTVRSSKRSEGHGAAPARCKAIVSSCPDMTASEARTAVNLVRRGYGWVHQRESRRRRPRTAEPRH
ncbi:MAG: hypothetical protein ACE1ZF_03175, partial [Gemmatimonadales bacterium]